MPNWCDNDLVVRGDAEEIKRFEYEARGEDTCLSLEALVPPPDCPAYRDEPNQADVTSDPNWWYTWNVNNWGTKWDLCDPDLTETEIGEKKGKLVYSFDTAWAPPMEAVLTFSKNYPTLKFTLKFYECAMEYKGTLVAKAGEAIKCVESKYSGNRGG